MSGLSIQRAMALVKGTPSIEPPRTFDPSVSAGTARADSWALPTIAGSGGCVRAPLLQAIAPDERANTQAQGTASHPRVKARAIWPIGTQPRPRRSARAANGKSPASVARVVIKTG